MTIDEMKTLKRERGYTYEQIAEWSGVPLGTVQKIFCGETRCPRYATLQALERVFRYERISYEIQGALNVSGRVQMVAEDTVYQVEKRQGQYTAQDYRELTGGRSGELIDGVVHLMEMPDPVHQSVVGELYRQLSNGVKASGSQAWVYTAPLEVCLFGQQSVLVQPDIMLITDSGQVTAQGIQGAPDFVAEVISDHSRRWDSFQKLVTYMEAGVKEYWIVDPKKDRLTMYWLEQEEIPVVTQLRGRSELRSSGGRLVIDWDEVDSCQEMTGWKGTEDAISSYK